MKKLRTTSWFLLLVILLTTLVSFTLAQETPTVADGLHFQQDSSEPLTSELLAHSAEETQVELSTISHLPQSFPAVSLNLSPTAGEDASQEPRDPVGLPVLPLPDDLYVPLAPETKASGPPVPAVFSASTEPRIDFSNGFAGVSEQVPLFSPNAVNGCQQLLGNPQLDVNEGAGTMLPWGILNPNIYFDKTIYTSAQYSLVLPDGDDGDPTPNQDAFGQAFMMPSNLNMVTITYYTLTGNTNSADYRRGELYTLDGSGAIKDYLGGWDDNAESEGIWVKHIVTITDPAFLQAMQGQDILLVLFNVTTNSAPFEVSYYDDVTLDACYEDTGQIIVKKETDPSGSAQKFTFDPSWSASNFQLSHGQSRNSGALAPGTYSVSELPVSGWTQTSATCDDGSSPGSISLQAGETVTCTFKNVQDTANKDCRQVLVNTKLDIDEFGDGTGSAEPWTIVIPTVYYTNVEGRAYDGYSLVLKDGDDDPSPDIDMFAQGFLMPGNLTEIEVEYQRATQNTNAADEAHGELWLLDDDWVLHLGEPDKYFVGGWTVAESDGAWAKQIITSNDSAFLNAMAGQKMAVLLFNLTDNTGAKEEVFFDNISLTACSKGAPGNRKVYLPAIMQKFGKAAGPICTPPNENPADQFHSNRGLVQTGATCNSTLSNIDKRDYYTFTPTVGGNHTLRLSNLPAGTEWAASIWTDIAKPTYAPGGSASGLCLTDQGGSGNKQVVCTLNKGNNYFVRIDSGSTPGSGGYQMKITAP